MPPDQWTRMSVDGDRLTVTVRVSGRFADLVFKGADLVDLKKCVDAATVARPPK
jgi:hypothetical protein